MRFVSSSGRQTAGRFSLVRLHIDRGEEAQRTWHAEEPQIFFHKCMDEINIVACCRR